MIEVQPVRTTLAARGGTLLALALSLACGTPQKVTPEQSAAARKAAAQAQAKTSKSMAAEAAPPPPPAPEPAKPPPPAPTPAPAAAPVVTLKDQIDDENWLPASGSARDAFLAAVDTARTDPAAAVARFLEAAGKAQYFYAAYYNAGASAESAADLPMAEKYYRQTLTIRPDYGPALTNLAGVLEKTGRAAEAQRLVDDAVRKMPEKAGPHLAAATLAWSRKDLATTEKEALLAIKFDERNVPAMRLMAMVFRAQGRLDTARFALENALDVEPGNALLHLELGHVLVEQNDEKAALVAFEKAARLRPTLLEALDNYGVLLLKQGMAAEATRALDQAARLDPRAARAQLHLGNALRASKSYGLAEAAYKKALEIEPALGEARFNLGLLYIDNPVPGMDELQRWQKGLAELKAFKGTGRADAATSARLDEYIDVVDKRIQKEIKKRERDERRKREDEKAARDAAKDAAAAPAAGTNDGKAGDPGKNPKAGGAVKPAPGPTK